MAKKVVFVQGVLSNFEKKELRAKSAPTVAEQELEDQIDEVLVPHRRGDRGSARQESHDRNRRSYARYVLVHYGRCPTAANPT